MLNKILILDRPLAILDFETTGLNPDIDRVIQAGITMHYPDKDPIEWNSLINPGIPITNSNKHKITDEMVKDKPTFSHHAAGLSKHLLTSDICGYNIPFDIGFLKAEMRRANTPFDWNNHIIDALQIYKIKRGHTLTNCYLEFGGENGEPLPPNTKVDEAHDAGFDVMMTQTSLRGQLLRFPNLPRTVKELADFCFPHPENAVDKTGKFVWVGNEAAFNFGKWRGKLLKDPSVRHYLRWLSEADFPEDVKKIARDALDGHFPTK